MKRFITAVVLLISIYTSLSWAEYRAFLLKITKPVPETETDKNAQPTFRLVYSTLDHLQYRSYYPTEAGETIQYIDTWMCRGRTGSMTPICPSPRQPANSPETNP